MKKTIFFLVGLFLLPSANATLLKYDFVATNGTIATFLYNDPTLDGTSSDIDLISISGDFGLGHMEYLFNGAGINTFNYDISTGDWLSWTSGVSVFGVTLNGAYTIEYGNTFGNSFHIRAGTSPFIDFHELARTQNIASVPEPTTLAIFALGIMGLASRRFKKKS